MYGLIHKELRQMIIDNYGDETWRQVLEASGVPEDAFLTMRAYDDSIAYDLVGASSKVLGASAEECLELFGRYWMLHSTPRSYAALVEVTGKDMFEFLENLNSLHDRITTTFIDYQPPKFRLEREADNRSRLHYVSTRKGLTPFVAGLLTGIAEHFGVTAEVDKTESVPVENGEYTIFSIIVAE